MKKILYTMNTDQKDYVDQMTNHNVEFISSKDITIADVQDVSAIVGAVPLDIINNAPKLEWLHLQSSGANVYANKINPNVTLTCSTGCFGVAIAEHLLASVLFFYKKFNRYYDNFLTHDWIDLGEIQSIEGKTTLILGLGDIGSEFAKRMQCLGSKVIGIKRDITKKPDYIDEVYTMDHLDELLQSADIIACCLPDTPSTTNVLNENMMKCKKDALLLSVGRGTNVNTDALVKTIESGIFMGVQLDVTNPEPLPRNHILWTFDNVFITPHISGNTNLASTRKKLVDLSIRNINNYLNNQPLENIVDQKLGYRKK